MRKGEIARYKHNLPHNPDFWPFFPECLGKKDRADQIANFVMLDIDLIWSHQLLKLQGNFNDNIKMGLMQTFFFFFEKIKKNKKLLVLSILSSVHNVFKCLSAQVC